MPAGYDAAVKSKARAGKKDLSVKHIHTDDDSSNGVEQLITGKGIYWAPSNEVARPLPSMEIRQTAKQDSFSGASFVHSQAFASSFLPQKSAPATSLPLSRTKSLPHHCSRTKSRGFSNLLASVSRQVVSWQHQLRPKNHIFGDKPSAEADKESSRQTAAGFSCLLDGKTALQSDSILLSEDCNDASPYLASIPDFKPLSGALHAQAHESEDNCGITGTLVWMNSSASGDITKPWPVSTSGCRLDMPVFPQSGEANLSDLPI